MNTALVVFLAVLTGMLLPSAHAVIIKDVVVAGVSPVSATISFKTDVGTKATLLYLPLGQTPFPNGVYPGLGTAISANTGSSPYVMEHRITLAGLYSNSTYLVRIRADAADGTSASRTLEQAFKTPPKADTTPPIISNIAITLTPTSITASFQTNEPAISFGLGYDVPGQPRLRYGVVSFYNALYPKTTHTVNVGGLLPNTNYVYVLTASDLMWNKTTMPQVAFRTPK